MNIYYDARWTQINFPDGVSRYGTGIVQGFKENNIPITLLIKDKRQLKMLPSDMPYLLVNDPLSFSELFISRKLNKLGVDIVISPFQIFGSLGRKFKLVLTLHDIIYYLHPTPPANVEGIARGIWRLFHMAHWPQRLLLNSSDCVATVSKYSKTGIVKLGLTKRPIEVIYNAPSLDAEALKSIPSKPTKDILYMGAFMPYKNAEVLIRGMEHLPDDFSLHLLSRIKPERQKQLEKLIPTGKKVIFHNGVSDQEYIRLLKNAYCLASASKEEGFGLPLTEAQTLGTPVVCSDMTIFHEVAGNGALYFNSDNPQEFANQVTKLSDAKTTKALVANGHEQAAKFSWKQSAKKLYDICIKL